MTVLVTGGAGHLGNNAVRALLARRRKVRVLVHKESASLDGLDVEKCAGDLLDRPSLDKALEGVETVYHFAGIVSLAPKDGPRVLHTNVRGTRNVVEACLARGVKRLVHCSSIHALACAGPGGVTDESRPANDGPSSNAYDRSKTESESEIGGGIARGLDAVIVNPTAVIGPHDYAPRLAGRALIDMYSGKLKVGVEGGFNWVDVRDVAAGALAAEARGRTGERYLLSGHWASFRSLGVAMRQATGRPGPKIVAPLWLAKLGVPFVGAHAKYTGSRPIYTAAELRVLKEHRHCDSTKARVELGIEPRPLASTIADTFSFYERAGLLEPGVHRGRSLSVEAFL